MTDQSTIEIDIDGLTAEVDAAEYQADPDAVIADIRSARAEVSDLTSLYDEPDWDYDALTTAYGEDNTTEVQ